MDHSPQMAALSRWSTFPVDQRPRPVILTGESVHTPGFRTGDAKIAFTSGNVRSDVALEPGVVERLADRDQKTGGTTLVITAVERDHAEFGTDRGGTIFPAWRLTIADALGPVTVLDPAVVTWWPPGEPFHATFGRASEISADGLTLTYRFSGPLSRYYRISDATAVETGCAVVIAVTTEFLGSTGTAIPLAAELREVAVTLASPLSSRVLIDPGGYPAGHPQPGSIERQERKHPSRTSVAGDRTRQMPAKTAFGDDGSVPRAELR